jgi:hypothetical protein
MSVWEPVRLMTVLEHQVVPSDMLSLMEILFLSKR